jgi:hypothetical protein
MFSPQLPILKDRCIPVHLTGLLLLLASSGEALSCFSSGSSPFPVTVVLQKYTGP